MEDGTSNVERHDLAVRQIAANRFPFPDQQDWPSDYITLTNQSVKRRGVPGPNGTDYPDIVVINGRGELREIGEIELDVAEVYADRWAHASAACDDNTTSGVQHFFVYVPPGSEAEAIRLLEAHQISYAGVRTWALSSDRAVTIDPIVTNGDPKDHRAR